MSPDFTTTGDDIAKAIAQSVALAPYDPEWPIAFEAERARLLDVAPGRFLAIEHIGSTAVPGLSAKPLLDLLAGVRTIDEAFAVNGVMKSMGYTTSAAMNASLKTRQWFMRQSGGQRTHHLHVVVHGSDEWTKRLTFRDRLRAEPALRAEYLALKEELVRRFGDDREAYTEGKTAFITAASTTTRNAR